MVIPKEIQFVVRKLVENGFEAYLVGGCVRDFLRGVEPNDWDIATNAKPAETGKLFLRSYTDNKFGTVTVLTESENPRLKEIEITTYRVDEKYTDRRHPDSIRYAKTIEEDLARRDFTINAMALKTKSYKLQATSYKLIDPFKGQEDLKNKIIRAVGKIEDRFAEDALRMLRAVRFATIFDFSIEPKTRQAIKNNASWLQAISKERIRDEFLKIIMSPWAAAGIRLLGELNLLTYVIPELRETYGVTQNKHHIYEVYEHLWRSLDYAAKQGYSKYVRLAALLHDIGKPRTKQGEGPDATFYNHEVVGAKMTARILNRLKFSKKDIEKIVKLVCYHLFYYSPDEVGMSSVRRLVRRVGPENMRMLIQLRKADRIGSGVPKAEPYKLRHLRYIIEKVSQDPISAEMLKVSGNDVMNILGIQPGPVVGQILDILLNEIVNNPLKNKRALLKKKIIELGKLSENELKALAKTSRAQIKAIEIKRDEMTKKKYWVQ